MPTLASMTIEAAPPVTSVWVPAARRGPKLQPSGSGLVHTYQTDPYVLDVADWVYLQVAVEAYQIHPATVAELAALGPVGGANAKRWTVEGPLMHRPGDPGVGANCTIKLEVSTSLNADPGTDWREHDPGAEVRLRSARAKITVTRPHASYSFRVTRFALYGTRPSPPQRSLVVSAGVSDVIPAHMTRMLPQLDIEPGAVLTVEANAILRVQ